MAPVSGSSLIGIICQRFAIARWLFFLLSLSPSAAYSQYRFDSWTTEDGLPQSSVNDILQTRDSYLWMTTSDGLVRFDGVHFTVFNRANYPGMSSNRLTSLYQDKNDDLWIGSDDGGVNRLHNGVFTSFGVENGLLSNWIRGITRDASGALSVLLYEGPMRWQNGHFERMATGSFPSSGAINSTIVGHNGPAGFWSWSSRALTALVEDKVISWGQAQGLPPFKITVMAQDEHGKLWAAGAGKLFRNAQGRLVSSPLPSGCLPSEDIAFIQAPELKLICRGPKASLIFASPSGGERADVADSPLALSHPLSHMVFYEDREGILWIGVDGGGLHRVRRQAVTPIAELQGLRDHNVYPIYEAHDGAIWIAAWPHTLNRFVNGKFQYFTEKDGLLPNISALFQDRDGRLWVGSYSDGGLRVLENKRFVAPVQLPDLGVVRAILQDREGALWFGSQTKLVRYQNDLVTTFTTGDGLATNYVNVLTQDAAGNLWIGGPGGLTRWCAGRFTAYTVRDGLPSATVRALYVDSQGVLWIGTYDGGLARFHNGKFTRYGTRDGLFSNGVFQILEDSRGNLWMSSNQGIYRVKKQELNDFAAGKVSFINSVAYGKSDGMLIAECNGGHSPAGIRTRDGKLWFPTQNGVALIDPEHVPLNLDRPPVLIESFSADGAAVPLADPIKLKATQRSLTVQYTAINFAAPERINFKYKLEGVDQSWVLAGSRRTAYYSDLPHGQYVFRVIAANSDGVWNLVGKSLRIVVLPRFYQTWWFFVLTAAAAGVILYLGWRQRSSRLERAILAQQAFSRQLIASQEGERKRISAELHDSIGQRLAIIKNLTALYLNKDETSLAGRAQLQEISSETTQAIREIREISYNLRPYQLDRLGLTKTIASMLKKASTASGIAFAVDLDDIDGIFPDHSEISFYRIVQEGINNILRHSGATQAEVVIRRSEEKLLLLIRDNGAGFLCIADNGSSPAGAGFGLRNISERAALMGCHMAIDSTPGHGTIISVECILRRPKK